MKMFLASPALALCLILSACNDNQPPTTDNRSAMSDRSVAAAAAATPTPSQRRVAPVGGPAVQSSAAVPAQGAQWTLYCQTIRGPAHVQEGNLLKERLMSNPQLQAWYLVHNEDESLLCYGYYADVKEPKARADKKKIDALTGINGEPIFAGAVFQPIASPDPDSPAEWNLANVPEKAYWSLQIAAFRGFPERKKYAVEAVRGARAMGIEAYYFHGPTISSVCIGTWPIEAVRRQGLDNVAHADDPDRPLFVVNDVMPEHMKPIAKTKNGKEPLIIAPRLDVIDPSLKAMIQKYPTHEVNGYETEITSGDKQKIPSPSFLVQVPHRLVPGQDVYADTPDQVGPSDPDAVRVSHGIGAVDQNAAPIEREARPAQQDVGPAEHDAGPVDDGTSAATLGKLRTLGEH